MRVWLLVVLVCCVHAEAVTYLCHLFFFFANFFFFLLSQLAELDSELVSRPLLDAPIVQQPRVASFSVEQGNSASGSSSSSSDTKAPLRASSIMPESSPALPAWSIGLIVIFSICALGAVLFFIFARPKSGERGLCFLFSLVHFV